MLSLIFFGLLLFLCFLLVFRSRTSSLTRGSNGGRPGDPLCHRFRTSPPPISQGFGNRVFSRESGFFSFCARGGVLCTRASGGVGADFTICVVYVRNKRGPTIGSREEVLSRLL